MVAPNSLINYLFYLISLPSVGGIEGGGTKSFCMSLIKTSKEIETLREGGRILGEVLALVASAVRPGLITWKLEEIARREIKSRGAEPSFLGYQNMPGVSPFPAALCVSINQEVVHCFPSKKRALREGDIVGLDLGLRYKNLYTDAAVSVSVGKIGKLQQNLLDNTREALAAGIKQARAGNTIGDIAHAIETVAKKGGFTPIRDLVGHGVGHEVHEDPYVPNYGRAGTLDKLRLGMVIAIEPMFTTGGHHVVFQDNTWGVETADGSLASHFEHTVAITEAGPLILTKT